MAVAIQKACHLKPRLIEGRGGIFDVKANGELIYSKHETGRFPEEAEIIKRLKPLAAAKSG